VSDYLPFPRQTRRRRSSQPVLIEIGARSGWGYGPGLAALLDEIESPRMWDPIRSHGRTKVVTFPIDRADDLITLIEHREGRPVEVVAVDR
jgi:hypothetical protein